MTSHQLPGVKKASATRAREEEEEERERKQEEENRTEPVQEQLSGRTAVIFRPPSGRVIL